MISTAEIHRIARIDGLRFDQAEKDYVILRILTAVVRTLPDPPDWLFKGGTCMRHCYYRGYRFSEDLDFSCTSGKGASIAPDDRLDRIIRLIQEDSGIEIIIGRKLESEGNGQIEIPLHYSRGGARRSALPAVRIHLSFDEAVLAPPETREVEPVYSDIAPFRIWSYGLKEIVAEKMRALLQQQEKWPRPRDLYDLWFILCVKNDVIDFNDVLSLFQRKCEARGITPDIDRLVSDQLREWNREAWEKQLAPMMRQAPEYDTVWYDWIQFTQKKLRPSG